MFSFHERTRRLICRALFLLLGIVPMGAVLAWGAVVNSSSHRQQIVDRAESSLNARLIATEAYHPRAESLRLDELELRDRELGQPLFRAARVEVVDDPSSATRTLLLTGAELHTNPPYWRDLIRKQLTLDANSQPKLRLSGANPAIVSDGQSTKFDRFDARFEAIEGGRGGLIQLTPSGAMADQAPIALRWTRTLIGDAPTTSFELSTGNTPIDWTWCAELIGCGASLGSDCQFMGILRAAQGQNGWYGEITGRFSQIDMGHVSLQLFGGRLRGHATLDIERCTFRDGQLQEIAGTLRMSRGKMDLALFKSLSHWLSTRQGEPAIATADPVDFDELACAFALSPGGLNLSGRCENAPAGTMLQHGQTALLREPGVVVPIAALVNALSPPQLNLPTVTATRQTRELLNALPLPSARGPASADSF